MISSLLPGVRDLRTPLVTGALWTACIWLAFGRQLKISLGSPTRDLIKELGLQAVPATLWLAGGTLALILLGSLLVVERPPWTGLRSRLAFTATDFAAWVYAQDPDTGRLRALRRWWARHGSWERLGPIGRLHDETLGFKSSDEIVVNWIEGRFNAMLVAGRVPVMWSFPSGSEDEAGFRDFYDATEIDRESELLLLADLRERIVVEVRGEKGQAEVRIQMRFPDVFSEIDRLRTEAELRFSMFWPLTILSVLLSVQWTPWALTGLPVACLLARDGDRRRRVASDKTWAPIIAGEITTPNLDAINAASARLDRGEGALRSFSPEFDDAREQFKAILASERHDATVDPWQVDQPYWRS